MMDDDDAYKYDLTGREFGYLTVIKRLPDLNYYKKGYSTSYRRWECQCSCGNIVYVYESNLISGKTSSCGCKRGNGNKLKINEGNTKLIKLLNVYNNMKSRCYSKGNPMFDHYGGRGITVCDEWINEENGFENFVNWSYKNGYNPDNIHNSTLDRINVNEGYSPENCRWASYTVQLNNRRNNKYYEFDGGQHTLTEIARATGIYQSALYNRINYEGMSIEEAISHSKMKNAIYFVDKYGYIVNPPEV